MATSRLLVQLIPRPGGFARVQSRHAQELLDQPIHAGHVAFELADPAIATHLVERTGDDGKGRPELMGGVGGEVALDCKALLQTV